MSVINPVPLSEIQVYTEEMRCESDTNTVLDVVLQEFGIPYLCFSDGDFSENYDPIPEDLHEKLSGKFIDENEVFQRSSVLQFTFVMWAGRRFLVVKRYEDDLTLVQSSFIDFGR